MTTEEARAREGLKPCPFCGGEAEAVCLRISEDEVASWARCLSCHVRTDEIVDAYSDLPSARAAWNTRPTTTGGTDAHPSWCDGEGCSRCLPSLGGAEMREAAAKVAKEAADGARVLHNLAAKDHDRDGTLVHGEAWRTAKEIEARIRALPVEPASASGEVERYRDALEQIASGRVPESFDDDAPMNMREARELAAASLQPREREREA